MVRFAVLALAFISTPAYAQKVEDGSAENLTASQRTQLRGILAQVLPAPKQTLLYQLRFSSLNAYCGYYKQPQPDGVYGPMNPFWVHPGIGKYNFVKSDEYFNEQIFKYLDYCPSK